MKLCVFLSLLLTLAACNHASRAKTRSGVQSAGMTHFSPEDRREELQRKLRDETAARRKTFEKRGYTPEEARALAEAEYFRSGK